jgi:hypothetical protein
MQRKTKKKIFFIYEQLEKFAFFFIYIGKGYHHKKERLKKFCLIFYFFMLNLIF